MEDSRSSQGGKPYASVFGMMHWELDYRVVELSRCVPCAQQGSTAPSPVRRPYRKPVVAGVGQRGETQCRDYPTRPIDAGGVLETALKYQGVASEKRATTTEGP
jgi:hypothetical protein